MNKPDYNALLRSFWSSPVSLESIEDNAKNEGSNLPWTIMEGQAPNSNLFFSPPLWEIQSSWLNGYPVALAIQIG